MGYSEKTKITDGTDNVDVTASGAMKVDGSGVTQPVSGTVTANAGTNLNTSALALETGGNLAGAATSLAVMDDWDESDRAKVNLIVGQAGVQGGSGTVSASTQRVTLATDVALPAGTNTLGSVGVAPLTSGGLSTYHLVSAGSVNATNIKASAGQVFGWYIFNNAAAVRKVAFHNTAGTPTAGSSVFFSLVLPAGSGANVFLETGIAFSTGIAITTTTGVADSDSAAVTASDLIINIFYK
jgi:hypothetical protein